ncbi:hypothetical protein CBE01nite_25500 [Clostridium beijerinckii]|uniref:YvrJ family protein n=1 Tax=Clostridium beijerinckii TaxID=1520 RepID=A0AB74VQ65_CLOBE|nr:YvrJ family protein [Clostridium beijerinckii]NRZ29553.1 hypothetical protein [Clostridium beijerinckii]NYB99982.1 hypothetical protein [Clostridium beijerinckii]OOM22359.1 YvrJ protein family protein [Clostridium beijerinckii]QUN37946.1 YvrJ family protein [Clostridium beijerinckii]SQB12047.1 membrane-associated protein [Clostridium beijerinckii]
MGEMVTLITNVGFPIAVATYLLIRFETKIDGLTKAITDLSTVVTEHSNYKSDDKVA